MEYKEISRRVKRNYMIRNGFDKSIETVGLAFDEELKVAIEVNRVSCYRANKKRYASERVMLALFDNERTRKKHFPQVIDEASELC